jgi:hypothetical protein
MPIHVYNECALIKFNSSITLSYLPSFSPFFYNFTLFYFHIMSCDFLIPIKKTAKDIFKKYKYKETVYLRVVLVSNLVTTVHDY